MRQLYKLKETEIGTFPEEWQFLTVEDIKANDKKAIISGPFGSNISSKYFVESGIPVIRGNNLSADMTRFIDDGFVFVTPEKAKALDTWAVRGDIVFTAAGTLGQVGIIEDDSKYEKYVISNKQLRLRVNTALVRPLFAFYWFSSPEMVRYIQQRDTGSTIPLINLSVLKSLPIIVPPVEVQDEIVNILDSLDKKISYNRDINVTLEKIGQTVFKHWFIDFEFPGEKGKPYKLSGGAMVQSELGEIPRGWCAGKLDEVCNKITDGSHYSPKESNGGRLIATVKNMRTYDFELNSCKRISEEDYQRLIKSGCTPEKGDILFSKDGTMGITHPSRARGSTVIWGEAIGVRSCNHTFHRTGQVASIRKLALLFSY